MAQIQDLTVVGWSARAAAEAQRPAEPPAFGIVIRPRRAVAAAAVREPRGGTPLRVRG
jgi:hypothetical protein